MLTIALPAPASRSAGSSVVDPDGGEVVHVEGVAPFLVGMVEMPPSQPRAGSSTRPATTAPPSTTSRARRASARAAFTERSASRRPCSRSLATFETLFDACRQLVEQAQAAGHIDPEKDPAVLGGLLVATHRGLEALTKAGVDPAVLNRIATAAVDNIVLDPGST